MVELEADDALASAAASAAADRRVGQVVICTPDKDLAQCVRADRVVQLDRRSGVLNDEAAVVEKFGVSPTSIPDWLALVGDSADGFPGLPGWGKRSAALVLSEFGHLGAIPDAARHWPAALRNSVRSADKLAVVLAEGREPRRALPRARHAAPRRDDPPRRGGAPLGGAAGRVRLLGRAPQEPRPAAAGEQARPVAVPRRPPRRPGASPSRGVWSLPFSRGRELARQWAQRRRAVRNRRFRRAAERGPGRLGPPLVRRAPLARGARGGGGDRPANPPP